MGLASGAGGASGRLLTIEAARLASATPAISGPTHEFAFSTARTLRDTRNVVRVSLLFSPKSPSATTFFTHSLRLPFDLPALLFDLHRDSGGIYSTF